MHAHIAEGRRIFDTVVGSQAYGTNRPESDEDTVAVCIPLEEYFFSSKSFEQANYSETDRVIYCVRKAIRLMADNNPNMLDLLFTPERCIKLSTKYWEMIKENSDKFISKKCKFTFSGYAIAQLERIRNHRGFLLSPPKGAPSRVAFGLPEQSVFPTSQIDAIVLFADDFFPSDKKHYIMEELKAIQSDVILPLLRENVIEEYRPIAMEFFRLGVKSQMDAIKAIGNQFIKDEYKDAAISELRFASAMKNWKRFESWKANRNKKRAELEEKFGYDCYSADTEFLTSRGWRKYDEVQDNDELATFHPVKQTIEYQSPLERFDCEYKGVMYNLVGQHTDTFVSANHKMYIREFSRTTGEQGEWEFSEAARLPESFDTLNVVKPKINRQKLPSEFDQKILKSIDLQNYLRLMGWYVSEGTCQFRKDGTVKSIMISQSKPQSRLTQNLTRQINNGKINCNHYLVPASGIANYPENRWIFGRQISTYLYNDCGARKGKRLPNWVFSLTSREMTFLLVALLQGDGTQKNHQEGTFVYYTTYEQLADDVQRLAFLAGYETSKWGPYVSNTQFSNNLITFQIHINLKPISTRRRQRSSSVKKILTSKQRIVCFMVKNHTLVTRRNGKIGLHGNCKHAMHLVRLMRMGTEILSTGKVNVDRTNIDADELKAIRDGGWSYEKIETYSQDMDSQLNELYKTSTLIKSPDREFIDNLCMKVVKSYLEENK